MALKKARRVSQRSLAAGRPTGITRQARPKRLNASEGIIQKAVLDWLKANGIFAVRLNNIPVPTKSGGFRPVAMRGLADCHIDYPVHNIPVSIWVEFKTEKGKLSIHQEEFQRRVSEHYGFYAIVRSIDDMESYLNHVREQISDRIVNATKEISNGGI